MMHRPMSSGTARSQNPTSGTALNPIPSLTGLINHAVKSTAEMIIDNTGTHTAMLCGLEYHLPRRTAAPFFVYIRRTLTPKQTTTTPAASTCGAQYTDTCSAILCNSIPGTIGVILMISISDITVGTFLSATPLAHDLASSLGLAGALLAIALNSKY
jgi:hypothetical protein